MTANIYDQSQEISVMCSFGCTKKMLVQIFIFESLVLVVSSSIGAFLIGMFIGNIIFLQMSMLQSVPFQWQLPIYQFILMVVLAFICAYTSTK